MALRRRIHGLVSEDYGYARDDCLGFGHECSRQPAFLRR